MRLFLALPLNDEINALLDIWLSGLVPHFQPRVVPAAKRHLTIKFFGKVQQEDLSLLIDSIEKYCTGFSKPRGDLSVRGIGLFTSARASVILWAGVQDHLGWLADFAGGIRESLAGFGKQDTEHGWQPHITLARLANSCQIDLAAHCSQETNTSFGSFTPFSAVLYKSDLLPAGAQYEAIQEFWLG